MKTSRIPAAALLALTTIIAGACGGGEDEIPIPQHPEPANRVTLHYADALDVDLRRMEYRRHSGLFVQDVRVGEGSRADSGDVVTVHYTGWLSTGRKFDSSRDRDRPFPVPIGYGRVIQGWDQGIVGMRVGGPRDR